jgi:carbon-monoxide dehydrogenase small subunit
MKKRILHITVNGIEKDILIAPNQVLLEVLRENLGLTGTKFGCELGECGACTVLVDGTPKLSCITLATLCEGADVTTVEGIEGPELEVIANAFAEAGASQCGYCTPSMAIMLKHLLEREDDVDVRTELSGNICRCTGFVKILKAYEESLQRARK